MILDIIIEVLIYFIFSIIGSYFREWFLLNKAISKYSSQKHHYRKRKTSFPRINISRIIITSILVTIFIYGAKGWIFPDSWTDRQYIIISTGLGLVGYSILSVLVNKPSSILKVLDKTEAIKSLDEVDNDYITNLEED